MLASFWNDFLISVEKDHKEKNPIIYSLLKQLKPVELSEQKITLSCDNQASYFFLQKRTPLLASYLSKYMNRKIDIDIIVTIPQKRKVDAPLLKFEPNADDVYRRAGISGKHTFENFAVSPTNQVAYAASQAVAKDMGRAYNPLFLWGGVGVGKTHLAQAVAQKVLEKDPEKKVLFSPGDLFTNELIEAIREKATQRFRKKYRKLDLLIIDDVQFIAGKNAVQEEFFHTFNSIIGAGGQIIMTSDRPPAEIKNLEDRLRSRFSGGLIVDIQEPDFELRAAILLIKAKEKNTEVDIEIAKIIAEQVSDTRALEGTLLSIYAQALSNNDGIVDLETVENFFSNKKTPNTATKKITPSDVIKTVCSFYDIKQAHIKSPVRTDSIAHPRQVIMYLLRTELKLKLDEIAFILKRKDHTTVLHGSNKVARTMMRDNNFKQEVDRIVQSLRQST